jgi:hypothetical protein
MNATIYKFPTKETSEVAPLQLPLFFEQEIEVLLICVNTFSDEKHDWDSISGVDPSLAIACLNVAKNSWYFSDGFLDIIDDMLNNVIGL